jgi:hypothetical protein
LAYHESRRKRLEIAETVSDVEMSSNIDVEDVEEALKQALNI